MKYKISKLELISYMVIWHKLSGHLDLNWWWVATMVVGSTVLAASYTVFSKRKENT